MIRRLSIALLSWTVLAACSSAGQTAGDLAPAEAGGTSQGNAGKTSASGAGGASLGGLGGMATAGESSQGGSGNNQAGTSSSSGTSGTSTTGGSSGSGGSQTQVAMRGAPGVSIREIAIYQGVKRTLMKDGAATNSNTPVVANREGLIRVFYSVDGGYNGQPVRAELAIGGSDPLVVEQQLSGTSSDANANSTLNFKVPGSMLTSGASYSVKLLQEGDASSGNAGALFPASGTENMGISGASKTLRVRLIPVQYQADGSNRLPDTSAAQVKRYQELFMGMYPVSNVEVTVNDSVGWGQTISQNGSGWDELLNAMYSYRQSQNPSSDTYFYGIFAPASSMASYCSQGCVAGLSAVPGTNDGYLRASIGLGFSGEDAAQTAVHEVGHAHGRNHAPCTPFGSLSGVDGNYPYSGGKTGVWGYHVLTGKFYSPDSSKDMMSYCEPAWISDYNFQGLYKRVQSVSAADFIYGPEGQGPIYDQVLIKSDGSVQWGPTVHLERPLDGEKVKVQAIAENSTTELEGQFVPFDHLSGGILFVPKVSSSGQGSPVKVKRFEISWKGSIKVVDQQLLQGAKAAHFVPVIH
jgi:hypothetical protein